MDETTSDTPKSDIQIVDDAPESALSRLSDVVLAVGVVGEAGDGEICMNGPAARRVQVGDIVIIISYGSIEKEEAGNHKPIIIFPDQDNRLVQ